MLVKQFLQNDLSSSGFVQIAMCSTTAKPFKDQNYFELKRQCLEEGKLFEDPEFPACDASLFYNTPPQGRVEWKRPQVFVKYLFYLSLIISIVWLNSHLLMAWLWHNVSQFIEISCAQALFTTSSLLPLGVHQISWVNQQLSPVMSEPGIYGYQDHVG